MFTLTRTFDAPRGRVFAAWSDPGQFARWWGPKGVGCALSRMAFQPGGMLLYAMRPPGGAEMWGRFVYREIAAPERIVFASAFADAAGEVARAPFFDGGWPLEVLNTVTFTEHDARTTLTLSAAPLTPTDAEAATFAAARPSLEQGFGGTFDQLAALLAEG